MKSKKMKQALALLCAGAMTVTGMNLPVNVMSTDAAAELAQNIQMNVSKTETEERGNDSIVTVNGMKEIDSAILAENAKANSEQIPAGYVNDGGGSWAFDDLDHWWHSRYQNTPQEGEVASGSPSDQNPIWIQTGFGESKKITKVTYQSRSNRHGIINKYALQIANTENPTDDDFTTVKEGNLANTTDVQQIVLDQPQQATHIRLVAYSVYINSSANNVAAKRIRVYEEDPEASVAYDTNKQSEYWDYETQKGTLAQQTEDDRWHYQIKENGVWSDLPENAFKGSAWMNNGSQDSKYHWAKLAKNEITSTFSNSSQEALAFSWKAYRNGYYKATLEQNMVNTGGSKLDFVIGHAKSGETGDGEILLQETLGNGQTFESKIAKVEAGDLIRIGATRKNAWVQNFLPMVEEVTAKDYAVQYLEEVATVEENGTYTEDSKEAVKEARTQLTEAVNAEIPDMQDIETKITALEEAIKGLTPYVAVENVELDKTELSLQVGQSDTLVATVTPETATDQEVVWSSDTDVVTVDKNGSVEAKKVGTAEITAQSAPHPDIKATSVVTVTRNDAKLNKAIVEAEAKMAEVDYSEKYTETSRKELETALEAAKGIKEDLTAGQGEVDEAVAQLKAAIEGLQAKFVITINNNGTTETKYCETGDQVTVVAKPAPEGQKFSHWTVNGTPISYKESYTFIVYGDTTVEAVYIEESETVEKTVNVLCNVSYENGKVKFVSKHSVPTDQGYKVLKVGVVATDQIGYDKISAAGSELTLDTTETTRLKKYGAETNSFLANYTKYLKTSSPNTWYARGYVTYQDKDGETHTVYSDLASYTIK